MERYLVRGLQRPIATDSTSVDPSQDGVSGLESI